jgi:hypothetical protein
MFFNLHLKLGRLRWFDSRHAYVRATFVLKRTWLSIRRSSEFVAPEPFTE